MWCALGREVEEGGEDEAEAGEAGEGGVIDTGWLWVAALFAVAAYCVVQTIRDIRAKRYAWAVAAAISAAVLLSMPIPTHSVVVDLPKR